MMDTHSQQSYNDPWKLVEDKHYQQALEVYAHLYAQDGRPSHLYNQGLIYLALQDYTAALEAFTRVIAVKPHDRRSDSEYLYQGICFWYLNHPSRTVEIWRQSLAAPYTDAAGGVQASAILLYAAERLQDTPLRKEALRLLRKHARRKLQGWPGPIVPFLLEQHNAAELDWQVSVSTVRNQTLLDRWQCQADFYIALRALREGDRGLFTGRMIRCAQSPYGLLEPEYYLALWEVQRQFPDPAFVR